MYRFHKVTVIHVYQDDNKVETLSKMKSLGIPDVPTRLCRVGVDQLHRGPWQYRRVFSEASIDEMSSSLVASGINITPLVICPRKSGGYFIICGERRWRGAQRGQIPELLCIEGDFNDEQAAHIAIVDNIQREAFNPIEEAHALRAFEDSGKTHEQIAEAIGRSRGHVSNYLRLLELDLSVRDMLIRGSLTASHGRLLCSIDSGVQQRSLATAAVRNKWSYKTLQSKINEILKKPNPVADLSKGDPDIARLERIISEHTGYACVIRKSERGVWQAGFMMTDNEQFAGLLERMGIDVEL